LNQIDSTVYQVEKFVDDYKDKSEILTEDDKTYFNNKIEELKSVREGNLSNADNLITEINQRLAAVGSKVYSNSQQQPNSNPFGSNFDFNGSNFNDVFKTSQNTNSTNQQEDVEEV
jgi:hypothetical protein